MNFKWEDSFGVGVRRGQEDKRTKVKRECEYD
jgi:hypothetical protein